MGEFGIEYQFPTNIASTNQKTLRFSGAGCHFSTCLETYCILERDPTPFPHTCKSRADTLACEGKLTALERGSPSALGVDMCCGVSSVSFEGGGGGLALMAIFSCSRSPMTFNSCCAWPTTVAHLKALTYRKLHHGNCRFRMLVTPVARK